MYKLELFWSLPQLESMGMYKSSDREFAPMAWDDVKLAEQDGQKIIAQMHPHFKQALIGARIVKIETEVMLYNSL
jgi:hypothetical protein